MLDQHIFCLPCLCQIGTFVTLPILEMGMPDTIRPAAYWLDRAVALEAEGKEKQCQLALNAAIRADDDEYAFNPATATLPRKAA